jgi:hypothetical protein
MDGDFLREIRKRSAVPLYAAAAVWALWCLFLPLYRLWHFMALIVFTSAVGLVFGRIFPGSTEYIEVPLKPVTTGDEKRDALLREGEMAVKEMKRLQVSIKSESLRIKIEKLISLTDRIFKDIIEDPDDYSQVKRFANYYLPTTLKLLNAYDRMAAHEIEGENISGTMERIDKILDTTIIAYQKQLDALFKNQALDIETDIVVLEGMLKREGLSGKDF